MNAFRDAIAASIDCTYFFGLDEPYEENVPVTEANAILAMPEMQAIRLALHALTKEYERQRLVLGIYLPESVITWVLAS